MRRSTSPLLWDEGGEESYRRSHALKAMRMARPSSVDDEDRREACPEEPRGRPDPGGRHDEAARDREERPGHLPRARRCEVERHHHAEAEVASSSQLDSRSHASAASSASLKP